jgi:hypothetical protein
MHVQNVAPPAKSASPARFCTYVVLNLARLAETRRQAS